MEKMTDYGLWQLVFINSLIILIFAFSFFQPHTRREWRTFGTFAAFVVALFTEMYGFPLTIYLLSGWLSSRFPGINWFSHDSSHLLQMLLGWKGDPHFSPFHFISDAMILGGLILLAVSWRVLYRARRSLEIARSGPYACVRHPQYAAFIIIMLGFLIQWPTLPTLIMFPVLILAYQRLARREEKEALAEFGELYARYAQNTPRFIPHIRWSSAI